MSWLGRLWAWMAVRDPLDVDFELPEDPVTSRPIPLDMRRRAIDQVYDTLPPEEPKQ